MIFFILNGTKVEIDIFHDLNKIVKTLKMDIIAFFMNLMWLHSYPIDSLLLVNEETLVDLDLIMKFSNKLVYNPSFQVTKFFLYLKFLQQ